MLNKLSQKQFEHILDVLILYNQLTPDTTEVYLTEKSIKEALVFMKEKGSQFADQLGME